MPGMQRPASLRSTDIAIGAYGMPTEGAPRNTFALRQLARVSVQGAPEHRLGQTAPGPLRCVFQSRSGGPEPAMSKLPQAVATVQADNERVRVTEWRFAPGAETGEHVHQMDYVVVPLADGQLKIVSPQGKASLVPLKAGASYFRKAGVHHNVINPNAFDYAFVEIELKA